MIPNISSSFNRHPKRTIVTKSSVLCGVPEPYRTPCKPRMPYTLVLFTDSFNHNVHLNHGWTREVDLNISGCPLLHKLRILGTYNLQQIFDTSRSKHLHTTTDQICSCVTSLRRWINSGMATRISSRPSSRMSSKAFRASRIPASSCPILNL